MNVLKYFYIIFTFRYDIENKPPIASKDFENKFHVLIKSAGLYIQQTLKYLATSPNRLINSSGIIEIKFPSSIKDYTSEEGMNDKKLKFTTIVDGEFLNEKKIYC